MQDTYIYGNSLNSNFIHIKYKIQNTKYKIQNKNKNKNKNKK